ncbi:UDP-glycosyltransferase 75C1 [Lactuca sativa]|uniref:UDP-glycosyltransferase 75C1 n=1 Tax=Lactuca sativa TaxID=4236 RepID=UPI000CA926DA|nr:UDP-glycosyltransferase 75C1 [Lactuca sativa]
MNNYHFLLVSLPHKSHINPTFRLATKLTRAGARVTLATTINGLKTLPSVPGLSYHFFSDGGAAGKPNYLQEIKLAGLSNLKELLITKAKEGQKVDFLIYGICLPWVAEVARELQVPSALFFIQSAASFSVVYHLFRSDGGVGNSNIDPSGTVKIPGLPLLRYSEVPSFLLTTHALAVVFQEHIEILEKHPDSFILINSFNALEEDSIEAIPDHRNIYTVGPLVSGDTEEPFVSDTFQDSDRETYLRWLDTKPEKSVVYVSFGSLLKLQKNQKEEIFQGLIEFGHPFLWVIRHNGENDEEEVMRYTAEGGGLIVRWCSQVEVLNHVAIGCFVTHCGWNSTLESVVSGVPMVGCPQNADQKLNAKMVEEVWGNGVKAVADGEDVVGREEMKRCLAVVMGGGEIKRNSEILKSMAMEATVEGGSSHTNLNRFFETLKRVS